MGLIKAAVGAVGSTLHDQWKEAIRCDDLGNDILMKRVTTPTGVISNGSAVIVGPGQMAVIYDNGRILDATAEDGVYTWNDSSTPSFFAGQFGEVFKEMWQRFTYNGASMKEQAVFFINTKEIIDNKYGTPAPIPYRDWEHAVMNARTNSYTPMSVKVKCFGKYTFKISNPALFMQMIAGTAEVYYKASLVEQLRSEVIAAFTNVLNSLGADDKKVGALSLPSKTLEIKELMDKNVFDAPIRARGVQLVSFNVESVTLDEESNEKINQYEIGGDVYQQKGVTVDAYAKAIQSAAQNEGGAMNGFMGVGVMNMATGNVVGAATNQAMATPMPAGPTEPVNPSVPVEPVKPVVVETPSTVEEVKPQTENVEKAAAFCTNCGAPASGNFCGQCGHKLK